MGKETVIMYDVANNRINHAQETLVLAQQIGLIKRRGNTYIYKDKKYSKANIVDKLNNNMKLLASIQEKVRIKLLKG